MNDIALSLPYPPSTNRIWRHVVRGGKSQTLLSQAGRIYRSQVLGACIEQRIAGKKLAGRLSVTVVAQMPDRRARDLDNVLKATLDALTHAGVWLDDSQIDRLSVVRGPQQLGGALQVTIGGVEE